MKTSKKVQALKELRALTDLGMLWCKKALEQCNWDVDGAIGVLKKEGHLNNPSPRKELSSGLFKTYVHHNGQIAVMIEVNCETDFTAKSKEFLEFCEDLTLHIAAAKPTYLSVNDIPCSVMEKKREQFRLEVINQTDPFVESSRVVHAVNNKLKKWFAEVCLVDQKSLTADRRTVEQMRSDVVKTVQENVIIRRFVRWELGNAEI